MDKGEDDSKITPQVKESDDEKLITSTCKPRNRGKKRKRRNSENSSDLEDILPENALEVEKNVQTAAMKNNLDDASVKKILKKVVTNDHVLALVKLREEEENAALKEKNLQPKLTRAKAKELMRVSPKSAPWNLELTPIKHIPVKTRPEVEALISKELPEDEDDDEYEPTHDDVPSDDDQTIETCSDIDSQPATPATPCSLHTSSPQVVKDGPFKVPLPGASTPVRRKLIIEEEATIALRTRSKLSLSATPIEHIESSFVPPDDVPMPIGDDLWNQFLEECLNPAETSKNEDDDETDPEYNVAADPDAHDEDEEALENSIIKISKKELNDLVTELFSIMPEVSTEDELAVNLASNVLADNAANGIPLPISQPWEGKQEPTSDEERDKQTVNQSQTVAQRRDSCNRLSIGKSEPGDIDITECDETEAEIQTKEEDINAMVEKTISNSKKRSKAVKISVELETSSVRPPAPARPPPPESLLRAALTTRHASELTIDVHDGHKVFPEQVLILQQQLRQHVQLSASNYLQLFVNPAHWHLAHTYKEYLVQLNKMVESNPKSVANVCNLQPALELVKSWEETVSPDTLENKQLVEFIQNESERGRRRYAQNHFYMGNFPELFMKVVANSTVFQYPYLLPAMPYRADSNRRFGYTRTEDEYITLGLDQFWQYVEDNPDLYQRPRNATANGRHRWGLVATCNLIVEHMMPWMTSRLLQMHVTRARKEKNNPIAKFFLNREVTPVQHSLLPFNPEMTLYEQPENEMPRAWLRYLAKSSKRFKYFYYKRPSTGVPANGVPVTVNIKEPKKNPLPIDFTKVIHCNRINSKPKQPEIHQDKFDIVPVVQPVTHSITGPMLTINPLTTDNNNFITVKTTEKDPLAIAEKVPVPASTTIQVKNNTNQVVGTLIPVCISNLTTQNNQVTRAKSRNVEDLTAINTTISNDYAILSNMFKVVQTSLGAYLIPLTVQKNTNTVNSISTPISSTAANSCIVGNNLPESSKNATIKEVEIPKKLKDNSSETMHCQCCTLIRKICKEKQSRITDFFGTKKTEEKPCECTQRKFPKISKRLRILISSFKSRSWCEQRKIRSMLKTSDINGTNEVKQQPCIVDDDECSLEDIEYVTTYHMKLTRQSLLDRNSQLKTKIDSMFSNFDPDVDNPILFSEKLCEAFGVELGELYEEFMGFLTPEQADIIKRFKDHFIHNCVGDLVKRIEAEVQDKESRENILNYLNSIFTDKASSSCEICVGILNKLTQYPRLAKHVFSLFPHRVAVRENERNDTQSVVSSTSRPEASNMSLDEQIDEPEGNLTICEQPETLVVMDCDNDNISFTRSDEIEDNQETLARDSNTTNTTDETVVVKNEDTPLLIEETTRAESVISNSESTIMSPLVMSEDEQPETEIKSEPPDWTREEDKFILETLLKYVTPQERKEKTILEILDEKNVYQIIAEKFPDKCIDDVKNRVMHILEILVISDL